MTYRDEIEALAGDIRKALDDPRVDVLNSMAGYALSVLKRHALSSLDGEWKPGVVLVASVTIGGGVQLEASREMTDSKTLTVLKYLVKVLEDRGVEESAKEDDEQQGGE